ncbi:MAG: helix-turn-helix transcriptional regulator [Coriobacteriales bacterium]|nr:helix-turn-helix transcriptional regulator [Coriobacteriales bacterium]
MKNLALERHRRGLSQSGLSQLAGVPRTQISMIETGRIVAWPGHLKRLAKALDWKSDPKDLIKEVRL